jgi:hypothetical protein
LAQQEPQSLAPRIPTFPQTGQSRSSGARPKASNRTTSAQEAINFSGGDPLATVAAGGGWPDDSLSGDLANLAKLSSIAATRTRRRARSGSES